MLTADGETVADLRERRCRSDPGRRQRPADGETVADLRERLAATTGFAFEARLADWPTEEQDPSQLRR